MAQGYHYSPPVPAAQLPALAQMGVAGFVEPAPLARRA
jgi:hypothetical protein